MLDADLKFAPTPIHRMRRCIDQSNGLVSSLPSPSWLDCIITIRPDMIFGKDKGQPAPGRTRDRPGIRPVFHNNAAEVFGLGCQRRRSLTSQSEIFAGAAAKSE
jgi:hypothetical protein